MTTSQAPGSTTGPTKERKASSRMKGRRGVTALTPRVAGHDGGEELSLQQRLLELRRSFELELRKAPATTQTDRKLFLLVSVAGERFAYPAEFAAEVVVLPTVAPVPSAPPAVLGIVNYRGAICTVVSLRRVLGLPDQRATEGRLIVAKKLRFDTSFLADRVEGTCEIAEEEIQPLPPTVSDARTSFLCGSVVLGDQPVFVLDPVALCRLKAVSKA